MAHFEFLIRGLSFGWDKIQGNGGHVGNAALHAMGGDPEVEDEIMRRLLVRARRMAEKGEGRVHVWRDRADGPADIPEIRADEILAVRYINDGAPRLEYRGGRAPVDRLHEGVPVCLEMHGGQWWRMWACAGAPIYCYVQAPNRECAQEAFVDWLDEHDYSGAFAVVLPNDPEAEGIVGHTTLDCWDYTDGCWPAIPRHEWGARPVDANEAKALDAIAARMGE